MALTDKITVQPAATPASGVGGLNAKIDPAKFNFLVQTPEPPPAAPVVQPSPAIQTAKRVASSLLGFGETIGKAALNTVEHPITALTNLFPSIASAGYKIEYSTGAYSNSQLLAVANDKTADPNIRSSAQQVLNQRGFQADAKGKYGNLVGSLLSATDQTTGFSKDIAAGGTEMAQFIPGPAAGASTLTRYLSKGGLMAATMAVSSAMDDVASGRSIDWKNAAVQAVSGKLFGLTGEAIAPWKTVFKVPGFIASSAAIAGATGFASGKLSGQTNQEALQTAGEAAGQGAGFGLVFAGKDIAEAGLRRIMRPQYIDSLKKDSGITDPKALSDIVDLAKKSPVISSSFAKSITHIGEQLKVQEEGAVPYRAAEVSWNKATPAIKGALAEEVKYLVRPGISEEGMSPQDKFQLAVSKALQDPAILAKVPAIRSYVDSLFGIVTPAAAPLEKVADIRKPTPEEAVPMGHREQLSYLVQIGDLEGAKLYFDQLPKDTPHRSAYKAFLDEATKAPGSGQPATDAIKAPAKKAASILDTPQKAAEHDIVQALTSKDAAKAQEAYSRLGPDQQKTYKVLVDKLVSGEGGRIGGKLQAEYEKAKNAGDDKAANDIYSRMSAEEKKSVEGVTEAKPAEKVENPTLYRGRSSGGKGGDFYTTDKSYAEKFGNYKSQAEGKAAAVTDAVKLKAGAKVATADDLPAKLYNPEGGAGKLPFIDQEGAIKWAKDHRYDALDLRKVDEAMAKFSPDLQKESAFVVLDPKSVEPAKERVPVEKGKNPETPKPKKNILRQPGFINLFASSADREKMPEFSKYQTQLDEVRSERKRLDSQLAAYQKSQSDGSPESKALEREILSKGGDLMFKTAELEKKLDEIRYSTILEKTGTEPPEGTPAGLFHTHNLPGFIDLFGRTKEGKFRDAEAFLTKEIEDTRALRKTFDDRTKQVLAMPATEEQKAFLKALDHRGGELRFKQEDLQKKLDELRATNPSEAYKPKGDVTLSSGIDPGIDKFLKDDVVPLAKEAFELGKGAYDEVVSTVSPASKSGAEGTAGIIRHNAAKFWNEKEARIKRGQDRIKEFDKNTPDENIKFISDYESGKDSSQIAKQFQARTALAMEAIKSVNPDTTGFIDNYFPRMFESEEKASKELGAYSRSLKVKAGFLEQRKAPTIEDAVQFAREKNLQLISTNPEKLMQAYETQVYRYKMGKDIFNEMKAKGLARFVRDGQQPPENFVALDDRIAKSFFKTNAGMVRAGEWYASADGARVFNNYLSKGLSKSKIFQALLSVSNSLNNFQLGLSGFHALGVSINSAISDVALGFREVSSGKVGKGTADIAKGLSFGGAIADTYRKGKALKSDIVAGRNTALTEALNQAGGRIKLDETYLNNSLNQLSSRIKDGNYVGALTKVVPTLIEQFARPLMQNFVPTMKLGAFSDLAAFELNKDPYMSLEDRRAALGKNWDSVDNRFGQVVYDNVFWNRTFKDMLTVMTRSVGWNYGTVRELGGGVADLKSTLKKLASGKGLDLSDRTAYIVALPLTVALYGSLYQYLHTGKGPDSLEDYFYPKTGNALPNGKPERVSLPTYMKDVYAYSKDPVSTVEHKANPGIAAVIEMMQNKDYYGTQIRDTSAPAAQQALDVLTYAGTQFTPISLRGQVDSKGTESPDRRVEQFFGLNKAPASVDQTKGEKAIADILNSKFSETKTKAQEQAIQDKAAVREGTMSMADLVAKGELTPSGVKRFAKSAQLTALQRQFSALTGAEQKQVWDKLSADEKSRVKPYLHSTAGISPFSP